MFTPIATCRLHHVQPRQYLDDLMRVLPYWPRERYLELAPQHWARLAQLRWLRARTRRLDPNQLAAVVSRFTVPPARVSTLLTEA